METEAKFIVPTQDLAARLLEADALAGHLLGKPRRQDLLDVYGDTVERAFWSAGYVCRLRTQGNERLVTVKGLAPAVEGIHRRMELEVALEALSSQERRGGGGSSARTAGATAAPPSGSADLLEQPASWPPSEARDLVLRVVGERPLVPLFALNQERWIRAVGPEPAPVVELFVDRVELSVEASTAEWLLVEAELRPGGTEADLAGVARALREEWGLVPDPRSKFERAVERLGLDTAAGAKGTPPPAPVVKADRLLFDVLQRMPPRAEAARQGGTRTAARSTRRAKAAAPSADPGVPAESLPAEEAAAAGEATDQQPGPAPAPSPAGQAVDRQPMAAPAPAGDVTDGPSGSVPSPAPAEEQPPTEADGSEAEPAVAQKKRRAKPAPSAQWDRGALYEAAAGKLPQKPGLKPTDTMAEAARKTLVYHYLRMLRHEEGTRLGDDIEELHDMRVSTRRMRAAFRVFEEHLDPKLTKPFLRGLRSTGRILGAVRDLDVFREKTQHYLDTLPAERQEELDPLLAAWHEERERERAALIRYLDGDDYRTFVVRFGVSLQKQEEWPEASTGGVVRPSLLRDVVPPVLYERLAEVRAFDAVLSEPDAPLDRYHELRISAKGLRYTLEYFREILGPDAKSLIDDIKLLQDHLGDLQDAVVSSAVLRTFLAFGTWTWPKKAPAPALLDVGTVLPVTHYLLYRQEEADRLVRTFPEVWERIQSPEFSRRVASAVAGL